jgi:hypothetical protein
MRALMASQRGAPIWLEVHRQLFEKTPWWSVGKHLTIMAGTGSHDARQGIAKVL